MQGVTCNDPGFPETGASDFLGIVNYIVHSLPVVRGGPCVPNIQAVGEQYKAPLFFSRNLIFKD